MTQPSATTPPPAGGFHPLYHWNRLPLFLRIFVSMIAGAVVGGLAVGVIQALSSLVFPIQLQNLVLFVVFILVLALRPQGLIGASR